MTRNIKILTNFCQRLGRKLLLILTRQTVADTIKTELGIGPGEITPDGKFSLELVSCIGACDQAPAMLINDKLFVDLRPDMIADILKEY